MNPGEEANIPPKIYPLGDTAIVVQYGDTISRETLLKIKSLASLLDEKLFPGIIEYVPAYTTLTIFYDPWVVGEAGKYSAHEKAMDTILSCLNDLQPYTALSTRQIEIPVCYDRGFAPDLAFVASHNQLSPEEVIHIHTSMEYLVYMIGFAPGFPYLGGMDPKIAAPRKSRPNLSIPAGSVGIAGGQTGIYPIETPGGWQLIGRTPLSLFSPEGSPPALLQAGDRLRFVAITEKEFRAITENPKQALRGN